MGHVSRMKLSGCGRYLRTGLLLAVYGLAGFAPVSEAFETELSDEYVLREDESIAGARRALYGRLKEQASQQAGTYVMQSETLSGDGRLDSSMTIVTAAMIEAETLDERVTVTDDGRPTLHLRVKMSVDDSDLEARVKALDRAREKEQQLAQLREQNEHLRDQLKMVSAQTSPSATAPGMSPGLLASSLEAQARARNEGERPRVLDFGAMLDTASDRQMFNYKPMRLTDHPELQALVAIDKVAQRLNSSIETHALDYTSSGDVLNVTLQVSGLSDLRRLIETRMGFRFGDNGVIDQSDVERMPASDRARFFAAFFVMAPRPLVLVSDATQQGADGYRVDTATQLLVAAAHVSGEGDARSVGEPMPLSTDVAREVMQRQQLPAGVGLVLYQTPSSSKVTYGEGGVVRMHLQVSSVDPGPENGSTVRNALWTDLGRNPSSTPRG